MTKGFDTKHYAWKKSIDYRKKPEKYLVGKGEQGVLICEPYKSEILPFWKFRTPEIAQQSARKIYQLFLGYLKNSEFVGADLARKFLQMGFTRSRRYANYKGGKKYIDKNTQTTFIKGSGDESKSVSATIFYEAWQKAERNRRYKKLKLAWQEEYG